MVSSSQSAERVVLGIDTGGTFTDAAVVHASSRSVIGACKVPTRHSDLAASVAGAAEAALARTNTTASQIELVSVSTTLATNALVEGMGQPAGLVTLGFGAAELERAGVMDALGPVDRLIHCPSGGHDAHGNPRDDLESALAQIRSELTEAASAAGGWAVAAQFSVRNPGHERRVRDLLGEFGISSVTCSHELSARLGGPRRALTALLNARLIGLIGDLLHAVGESMARLGVTAPVMVVRGDGSLVSAPFAQDRPIETILSGPAASVVGALHLADVTDAIISDIGGTTTDVALVRDGRPLQGTDGAVVGGHRTMVEAVDMRTFGIGGDSEIVANPDSSPEPLDLGPRRALPMSRLAAEEGNAVHRILDHALAAQTLSATDGRLLVRSGSRTVDECDTREAEILQALADGPTRERIAAGNSLKLLALTRLRSRGLVRVATMTPTDAAIVLGLLDVEESDAPLDPEAAWKVAELLARQQDQRGLRIAPDAIGLAGCIQRSLIDKSARAVLSSALGWEGLETASAWQSDLVARAFEQSSATEGAPAVVRPRVDLAVPIVAVGASAETWYRAVAGLLGTTAIIPPHAEVANAVGAAVADVTVRGAVQLTQPRKGQFRVHVEEQLTLATLEQAQEAAENWLVPKLLADAQRAGAATPQTVLDWDVITAVVGGREVFVEATLSARAWGRPAAKQ